MSSLEFNFLDKHETETVAGTTEPAEYFSWEPCQKKSGKFSTVRMRTEGCCMNIVAFIEEVWSVVQCYGTQSMLKIGLNRSLMRKSLTNWKNAKKRWSYLLMDSSADESATNSPIKMTYQESNNKTVYLSRTRKIQCDERW